MSYPIQTVRGNWVRFHHPLEKVVWTESQKTIVDYVPQEGDKLTVTLQGAYTPYEMENVTIEGNVLKYENNGTLPCGLYDVVINVVLADGKRLRSHQDGIVKVVRTNKEASIPDYVEFGVDTYVLDGAVFMYVPNGEGESGEDGVGIDSITTVESPDDGGNNVVTIHLTDGTESSFNVKNGHKGSDGAQGPQGQQGPQGPTGPQGPQGTSPTLNYDNVPTNNSSNLLTSGTVFTALQGKEDKVAIITPTLNNNAFDATVGNYYKVTFSSAITIQLDTPDDTTKLSSCIFLITGSSGSVTFSAETGVDVYQSKGFTIATGKIYEVNALFNGTAWYLTQVEMEVQS